MRKPVIILVLVVLAGVGWILLKNFQIQGLEQLRLVPKGEGSLLDGPSRSPESPRPVASVGRAQRSAVRGATDTQNSAPLVRVATFFVEGFGLTKAKKPQVMDILARIGREFEVLAIQDITSESDDIVPRLVDLMNKTGRHFDTPWGRASGHRAVSNNLLLSSIPKPLFWIVMSFTRWMITMTCSVTSRWSAGSRREGRRPNMPSLSRW